MDIREILLKKRVIDIDTCLPDGVIFVSSDGKIGWSNSKAPLMFGLSKKELISCFIDGLLENGMVLIQKAALEKKALVTKVKNQEKYLEMTANENSDGFVVDLRDSTQSYKAVTNILVEQESSKKINRDKNKFILKISNDLKSPLHSIIGFSQALLDGLGGKVSDKQDKYIKIINKNSTELLYLLEKVFDLSLTESGTIEPELKTFDVVNMINSVIKINEQLYKDKNLSVKFEIEENASRTINTSEKSFKLLMQNLIETLIRMTDIGVIKIKLATPSPQFIETYNINPNLNYMMLSFINTGVGLPENELETIFDPYAMAERANKKLFLRALTLASVKNLVKLLHGIIWVDSEIITGTTFNIIFPTGKSAPSVPEIIQEETAKIEVIIPKEPEVIKQESETVEKVPEVIVQEPFIAENKSELVIKEQEIIAKEQEVIEKEQEIIEKESESKSDKVSKSLKGEKSENVKKNKQKKSVSD